MLKQLQARYKALITGLGGILGFLYVIETTKPNHYVELAIVVLTTLGVHQVPNKS